MMALGGYIGSPDDFHEIQKMDDNLELKSSDPNERLNQLVLKAQKTTDKLPRDKRPEWNKLLKEISEIRGETDEMWGDSEKNEVIDRVDRKISDFILRYVAEKIRQREEERKRVEDKVNLLDESFQLVDKYKASKESERVSLNMKPELSDDLIKMNSEIDGYFREVVDETAKFDEIFENFVPKGGLNVFNKSVMDGFNDLLAERLNIQRKSLEDMGVDEVLIMKISKLKTGSEYREFINREKDFFRNLFTKETPNGFVLKFDVLKNFEDKLSTEFYEKFSNFSKYTRLQDLLEDYEIDGQIEGGTVSLNGVSMVVKGFDESKDRMIGRRLEDGIDGEELHIKIYTNTVVEFNVRSLQQEYDLDGAKKDLEKEIKYDSSYEDLENQVLDLKFNREVFERAGDLESLVKLNDKIREGEAVIEMKKYEDTSGYETFFEITDMESVDGWVENLSEFANVNFLESLQEDFSDIDYNEESEREAYLMDLSVKVVGYKLNRIQEKLDLLPVESKLSKLLRTKLQEENQRFIDISLNIGDEKEDKNALNQELGLKRVSDHMVSLGSFDKAFQFFVEKSSVIDNNNFQSENLRKVYREFNKRCLFILQNYLNNEREMVIALGFKPEDYNEYLSNVNKLAKFITGRGESIDMELESGSDALVVITEALRLPEKMVEKTWDSPENVLMNDYSNYKNHLQEDLRKLSPEKRDEINDACDGKFEELIKLVEDDPKNVSEFSEKYMTLRILRDSLKGYDVDVKRYNVFLKNGANEYKNLCIQKTEKALSDSEGINEFVSSFGTKFSSQEMRLVKTLSDIQGFGWFNISDQTVHNAAFVAKFTALVGASLAASLLSTPFTGGASLLAGATGVAAIATTASHVLFGKGYDTTEEAMIGIGTEAGVNFFGAMGGGSMGAALRISALQKTTGLTREAVKKGLLTGDEAISVGALTNAEKALYFSGQMVGDVALNASLDIAVAKMTKEESDAFAEFERSVSNPLNWAVRAGGVSAGALGGGKFSKFLSSSRNPNANINFSNLKVTEKRSILRIYKGNGGLIDNKLVSYIRRLVEKDRIKVDTVSV